MGIPFAQGLQFVLDAQQKYVRASLPVYLRVANFTDEEQGDALQVGVPFSPTGTADVGFTDILIEPTPYARAISWHNIGMSGGRLMFGAKEFKVSHTWVHQQLQLEGFLKNNVTNGYDVFRNRDGYKCIGIWSDQFLYSIEEIDRFVVAGHTILWKLQCNRFEQNVTVQGGP